MGIPKVAGMDNELVDCLLQAASEMLDDMVRLSDQWADAVIVSMRPAMDAIQAAADKAVQDVITAAERNRRMLNQQLAAAIQAHKNGLDPALALTAAELRRQYGLPDPETIAEIEVPRAKPQKGRRKTLSR